MHFNKIVFALTFIMGDYLAILLADLLAHLVRIAIVPLFLTVPLFNEIPLMYKLVIIPLSVILFAHFDGLYKRRMLLWQVAGKLIKVSIYALLLVLVILFLSEAVKTFSRLYLLLLWLFSFPSLLFLRFLLKKVLLYLRIWQIPVLMIGGGLTGKLLYEATTKDPGLGLRITGIVDDLKENSFAYDVGLLKGNFQEAEKIIEKLEVKDVLIAAPGLSRQELTDLIYRLQLKVDNIIFVPDLFGVPVMDMEMDALFNEKVVLMKVRNNLARVHNRLLKSMFDWCATFLGVICLLPVMLLLAFLIYRDSPGKVFFAHQRIGRDGKSFPCFKFRTMVKNSAEVLEKHLKENVAARKEWEADFKLRNDPRITKIGRFLRKTSLDELPQLFNVLRGEMSLVGPRPIIEAEIKKYGKYIKDYYMVKPGVTGWWQVSGRNDVTYDERVQMDSWYVRNWALWFDIVLIFKTIGVVFGKKGAY